MKTLVWICVIIWAIWLFWPKKLPRLEDGEVVSGEDGIYRKCPECEQLVPQMVKMDDGFYEYVESHGVSTSGVDHEEMVPLIDLRGCITGYYDTDTQESKIHIQCRVCGMALKDIEGNVLYQ